MIKVSDYIENLKPYVPGMSIDEIKRKFSLERIYKLASNENSLGPSPKAVEAMKNTLAQLHRYPDISAIRLREKISLIDSLSPENIAIGNGSEGILAVLLRAFLVPGDEVISSEKTFIGFQVLARGREQKFIEIPMYPGEFRFNLKAISNAVNDKTKIIYICNPNNPTGTIVNGDELEEFLQSVPREVMIIIDEAYYEYARGRGNYESAVKFLSEFDNVVILRTFSKIYGIAGIRIGYSISSPEIAETIMKVKLPFEPGILAQEGAIASLDDEDFVNRSVRMNSEGYEYVTSIYGELKLNYIPSYANFVMIRMNSEGEVNKLTEYLLRNGVIIRPLKPFGLPDCLRITIGTPEENSFMGNNLQGFLSEVYP
ncbi:MAG: histidinol-phosphate transaminase [Ignavibacteriaceae bacterium]|jgi:histidinol-phosphate aminotransferase|nr:MAG: histidinol phosphate aminotransferase [Chlorobi bacterium OLB4]MBW7856221.1 histidinol-phosphate transaminase [Ignavibacteria bacterium]MEB2329127.1 histidinol-phosphate transaminase [Ignavibacteriaceae bacterium]OQY77965.1 MAG: histidinol-phosphate transaminase [Ignavibacteriales bacterium UTCHB1]